MDVYTDKITASELDQLTEEIGISEEPVWIPLCRVEVPRGWDFWRRYNLLGMSDDVDREKFAEEEGLGEWLEDYFEPDRCYAHYLETLFGPFGSQELAEKVAGYAFVDALWLMEHVCSAATVYSAPYSVMMAESNWSRLASVVDSFEQSEGATRGVLGAFLAETWGLFRADWSDWAIGPDLATRLSDIEGETMRNMVSAQTWSRIQAIKDQVWGDDALNAGIAREVERYLGTVAD